MKIIKRSGQEVGFDISKLSTGKTVTQHIEIDEDFNDIMIDVQKDKSNLELIQEKNNILENKLKDLLLEVKEQERNMLNTKNECEKKLILLNTDIKRQ